MANDVAVMAGKSGSAASGRPVRFLLGTRAVTLDTVDPTQTVLQWLRATGRPGTKEGCAEGDCGACTVVLAEPGPDGRMGYRAVNSCILFMPVLDGKQLLTVEDLKAADGTLHPVQQAMVDSHASQCGFCTPGFVMSLFALFHRPDGNAADDIIQDALGGNLCRCTGYRPILDAARQALARPRGDRHSGAEHETAERLATLRSDNSTAVENDDGRFFAPRSLAELSEAVAANPDAIFLAGGTDVGLWVTKQHRRLATVIYLGAVAELRGIVEKDGSLDIGAGVTYSELLPTFEKHWPSFGEMLRVLGSVQIRNSGTMGGNIANGSPIGDSMPALIALGTIVVLYSGGKRREMPLEDFFLAYRKTAIAPGEIVERIRIPLDPAWRFATYKLSKRYEQDISAVAVGIAVKLDGGRVVDIRIAFGGMAGTPKRAAAAEAALRGKAWSNEMIDMAVAALAKDYQPLSDMRASSEYRLVAAGNLLRRFYLETQGQTARMVR